MHLKGQGRRKPGGAVLPAQPAGSDHTQSDFLVTSPNALAPGSDPSFNGDKSTYNVHE